MSGVCIDGQRILRTVIKYTGRARELIDSLDLMMGDLRFGTDGEAV